MYRTLFLFSLGSLSLGLGEELPVIVFGSNAGIAAFALAFRRQLLQGIARLG